MEGVRRKAYLLEQNGVERLTKLGGNGQWTMWRFKENVWECTNSFFFSFFSFLPGGAFFLFLSFSFAFTST